MWAFYNSRSNAHSFLDEFDQAISDANAAIREKSDEFWPHLMLARAYASLGRLDEARAACARARELKPQLSAASLKTMMGAVPLPLQEKFLDALRKAGLPEE